MVEEVFGNTLKSMDKKNILAIFDTIVDFRHGIPFIVSFVKNEDCNAMISIRNLNSFHSVQGSITDIEGKIREKLQLVQVSTLDDSLNLSLKIKEFLVYSFFPMPFKRILIYLLNKIVGSIVTNQIKNISIKKNYAPNVIFTSENIIRKMPKLFENMPKKNKIFVIYETYGVFPSGQTLLPILEKCDSCFVIEHPQFSALDHNTRVVTLGIPRYWQCYILENFDRYKVPSEKKISNVLYVGQKLLDDDAVWTSSVVQSDNILFSLAKKLPKVKFFVKPHPRDGGKRYSEYARKHGLINLKILNEQNRLVPKTERIDFIIGGMGTSALVEAVVLDYPIAFFEGIDSYNELIKLGSPVYSQGYPRYGSVEGLLELMRKKLRNNADPIRKELVSYMGDPGLTVDQSDKYIFDYLQKAINA